MRGFAIPRRWLIPIALVGLVSLFATTLTTSWVDPSRAAAQTTPANLMASVFVSPNNANVVAGTDINLQARPVNGLGSVNTAMPNTTYTWTILSGGGSLANDNTRTPTLTVPGTAGAVVTVQVVADQQGNVKTATGIVNVIAAPVPPPPGTQVPDPSEPVPTFTPPTTLFKPSTGGNSSDGQLPPSTFSVPPGAHPQFLGLTISTRTENVPPANSSFRIGSKVVDVVFRDAAGNPIEGVTLSKAATICLPVTQEDIDAAAGSTAGLTIRRFVESTTHPDGGEWVELNTVYNPITKLACAQSSSFSIFALGLATAPPSTGTGLPATGDTPLSAALLALLGGTGVALVGAGAVALRRVRRTESAG